MHIRKRIFLLQHFLKYSYGSYFDMTESHLPLRLLSWKWPVGWAGPSEFLHFPLGMSSNCTLKRSESPVSRSEAHLNIMKPSSHCFFIRGFIQQEPSFPFQISVPAEAPHPPFLNMDALLSASDAMPILVCESGRISSWEELSRTSSFIIIMSRIYRSCIWEAGIGRH